MMPGASRVSMYAVPSPSGSSAIWWALTVVPVTPVVLFSIGASAVTVMVSSTPPADIVMSTRSTSPTPTLLSGRTTFLKPCSSADTEYVPGLRYSTSYRPLLSVTTCCDTPVSLLVTVIVTPGRTPPVVSTIVPATAPRKSWAAAGAAMTASAARQKGGSPTRR